ncbi:hypothetical protein RvY_10188-1 [Ramazzottius varieornatus]|uniref:Uncharacterized protein n=1 Tax=Ramazzottius varieornatus TaxID=947166 RepID=A0A1D1VHA7_RAMVA|nr:hypothetical protein RvY_10188-1 [Ramazzottius varieornatus]
MAKMSTKMLVLSAVLTCVLVLASAQVVAPSSSAPPPPPPPSATNKTDNTTQNNPGVLQAQDGPQGGPQGPGNRLLGTANVLCPGLSDPKSCMGRLQCDQQLLAVCVAGVCDCLGLTDARVPKEVLAGAPAVGGLLGGRQRRGLLGNVGNTVDNVVGGLLGGNNGQQPAQPAQPAQGGTPPAQGGQQPAQGGQEGGGGGLLGGLLGGR